LRAQRMRSPSPRRVLRTVSRVHLRIDTTMRSCQNRLQSSVHLPRLSRTFRARLRTQSTSTGKNSCCGERERRGEAARMCRRYISNAQFAKSSESEWTVPFECGRRQTNKPNKSEALSWLCWRPEGSSIDLFRIGATKENRQSWGDLILIVGQGQASQACRPRQSPLSDQKDYVQKCSKWSILALSEARVGHIWCTSTAENVKASSAQWRTLFVRARNGRK
jgi:hypothetical protein